MKILDVPQSGSVAGVTSSRNRFGQYRRTRATPVNPNTTPQAAARARLTTWSAAWRDLTEAQRIAWRAYAEAHPKTDSLGQTVTNTGHQAYVGVNSLLELLGEVAAATPPADPAFTANVTYTVLDTTVAGFEVDVDNALNADESVVAEVAPPASAGVNFAGDYRFVSAATAPIAADPVALAAQVVAKFGTIVAGMKLFVRLTQIRDGVKGPVALVAVILT